MEFSSLKSLLHLLFDMRISMLLGAISLVVTSCNVNTESSDYSSIQIEQGIPFTYSQDNRCKIFVQVVLYDSIPAKLLFDSGCERHLILKSSFADKFPKKQVVDKTLFIQSGYNDGFFFLSLIKDTLNIPIAENPIIFPEYCIADDDSPIWNILSDTDGILPIPTDIHDLSISFSKKRISINTQTCFENFDYCTSLCKPKGYSYAFKEFPLYVSGQDSVILCDSLIIDTGYRGDICCNGKIINEIFLNTLHLHHPLSLTMANHNSNLYCLRDTHYINRNLWVEHKLVNEEEKYVTNNILAGLEFLKSFDIYMDFERDSVYLKKIQYVSLLNDLDSSDGPLVSGRYGADKAFAVMYVKSKSIYERNGIRPGDIVLSVNNKPVSKYRDSITANTFQDTLNFIVKRKNDIMNIQFPPAK